MSILFTVFSALAVFITGYFAGRKSCFFELDTLYKKEYCRTNGLYEPVRRD